MTTPTDLHELLRAEAGGPMGGGPGWDDVVRRGRRRQQVRRAQRGVLAAVAVGAVVAGATLSGGDPQVETTPPATDPTTSLGYDTTTSTTAVPEAPPYLVSAARAQGELLSVIIPPADPTTGFDPCTALHARVVESAEQIGIELVTEQVERGLEWGLCSSTALSARATLELTDPLGDRPLIDLTTGDEVPVVDGASLLFPSELPEELARGVWDEFGYESTWTFAWNQADLFLNVTTNHSGSFQCERREVEVRGTTGSLCEGEGGRFDLQWEEDGRLINVEIGHVSDGTSPFTLDDVLTIAEGLQPYSEVGPEALGT
jgi:hypothetical protein